MDGAKLILGPEDYSRAAPLLATQKETGRSQRVCRASLLPVSGDDVLGPKAWILGEPALRKYYTAGQARPGQARPGQPGQARRIRQVPRRGSSESPRCASTTRPTT